MLSSLSLLLLSFMLSVCALPTRLQARSGVSKLSNAEINSFTPYTHYASAALCKSSDTLTWSCGPNCDANHHFKPFKSGGDGTFVQNWYVGYDAILKTIIVGHEGTEFSEILPAITDLNFPLKPLSQELFPGVSTSIEVHTGFRNAHRRSAGDVLDAVQDALTTFPTKKVTIVGHSLGAAIGLLSSIYLPMHLPADTVFRSVLYGMPRVGNPEFADYADSHTSLTFITNLKDIVPIVPPQAVGFRRVSGEIHINPDGSWTRCDGQDNDDPSCSTGAVSDVFSGFKGNTDHSGPYNGIYLTC